MDVRRQAGGDPPRATVEDGMFTHDANAVVLGRAERDRVFEAGPGMGGLPDQDLASDSAVALAEIPGPPNVIGQTFPNVEEHQSALGYERNT